jgi:hypothetical protein
MKSLFLPLLVLLSLAANADPLPDCLDNQGQVLPIDNAQVLEWKSSTQNQFRARAHVRGTLVKLYHDKNNHKHFGIQIGDNEGETLEVIYEKSFGPLPDLAPGMIVEACGDYITSSQATSQYPRSPDDAIIHWIHRSNSPHHPSGFVAINDVAFGT